MDSYSFGLLRLGSVRTLDHIKKLDDSFGLFFVRIICRCGATRDIEPKALALIAGWTTSLADLIPRMRCSKCGTKGECKVVAVPQPRPRGVPKNPH
jgi:hypothetical protein